MSRKITIKAFKYNPLSKISKPHFATYELEETDGMTLFIALNQICFVRNLTQILALTSFAAPASAEAAVC